MRFGNVRKATVMVVAKHHLAVNMAKDFLTVELDVFLKIAKMNFFTIIGKFLTPPPTYTVNTPFWKIDNKLHIVFFSWLTSHVQWLRKVI